MKKDIPKLNTLIIDPAPTQRMLLSHMVKKQPQLHLCGAYDNPTEAHGRLSEVPVDLIFLEIDLPHINSFNFIETLDDTTQVVLVTASDDHALKAFDYGVTDYLLKPLDPKRFEFCLKKVLKKYSGMQHTHKRESLVIRCDLQQREVRIADLLWVEAMGDYVKLFTSTERMVVLSTMKAMLKKLPKDRFLRIHRSYIVNLEMVDKFTSTSVEIGGKVFPMSRNRKPNLERLLQPQV